MQGRMATNKKNKKAREDDEAWPDRERASRFNRLLFAIHMI